MKSTLGSIVSVVLLLTLGSCRLVQRGESGAVPDKPKGSIKTGEYDLVWVEPRVVTSDSLATLMRASRIDSIPADPRLPKSIPATSVEFRVFKNDCLVSVTLNDAKGEILKSLLFRQLNPGLYRLTPASTATDLLLGQSGTLVVNACGSIIRQPVK